MLTKWGRKGWIAVTLAVILLALLFFLLCVHEFEQQATYDLNSDGIMENYHLLQGRLTINQPGGIEWSSPPGWDIRSFDLHDVTGDGKSELIMVLWKRGSFDRHKPLWEGQKDDNKYSCHLFLYQMNNDRLIPCWCSSALDKPIISFAVLEDSRGNKILAVEEGHFSIYCCGHALFLGKQKTNWTWKQWGFFRI